MARTRPRIALLAAVCVLLATVSGGAAMQQDDVYAVGTNHGLDTSESLSAFDLNGVASGEINGLNAELTISNKRAGVDDQVSTWRTADLKQDYLRIDYNEETSRTLRILIPAQMVTPYERRSVQSTPWSDRGTAELDVAREGNYLEVVITVAGDSDIVLPLSAQAQLTSGWIGDQRERAEEVSSFGESEEWTVVEGSELTNGSVSFPVEDPDAAVVQHDYKDAGEAWVPTPQDSVEDDGVYYYVDENDSGNGSVIRIVSHAEDPPAVRYKANASAADKVDGWVNDARRIPDRIGGLLPSDTFPWE